jgi:uroporphyrinogen decarboxylase
MVLTSRERIERILKHQPVDRIGCFESFWGETAGAWRGQGHLGSDENLDDHFDYDIRNSWPFFCGADIDNKETLLEETEETKLIRNANGAVLRFWKHKAGTPEHVDFLVTDRAGWEEHIRPHLVNDANDARRISFDAYASQRAKCQERQLWHNWSGVNVFEQMHPICGHEHMLIGMALDPEWIADMADVLSDLTIRLMEQLFAKEGRPDGIWFYEDMGFKEKPFMSPAMYRQLIWPAHKKTFDYAHSIGCPVTVHSCGFVEPLLGGLIEAGMDCLQAMEVKAGMDVRRIKQKCGDRIALMGGLDIRTLESNDLAKVEAELEAKVPIAMEGSGYVLFTDHSVSSGVEYDTYRYFLRRGLEIGTY